MFADLEATRVAMLKFGNFADYLAGKLPRPRLGRRRFMPSRTAYFRTAPVRSLVFLARL